jgi:hypothetical protein
MSNHNAQQWTRLKPGDIIEALCELVVTREGLKLHQISEAAEGRNFAIQIKDDSPEGGKWYAVEYLPEVRAYAYNPNEPLD